MFREVEYCRVVALVGGTCCIFNLSVISRGSGLSSTEEVRSTEKGVFNSKAGFKANCLAKRFNRGRAREARMKEGRWKRTNDAGLARMDVRVRSRKK